MGYWAYFNQLATRLKRKGFWLYTGLIFGSFVYLWYTIGHLPPPPRDPRPKLKMDTVQAKLERRRRASVDSTDCKLKPEVGLSKLHKVQSTDEPHVVDTWSRPQLYRYLHDERIFPPLETNLEDLRGQVKELYDKDTQHMSWVPSPSVSTKYIVAL